MAMEKTFDAATAEPRIYANWESEGRFAAGANASRDDTFTIMIPPPNVTGVLHMGHAFNNTLQDILIRWKRMQGFDTLWQPGTDHAGIATQMVVERKLAEESNTRRTDMSREDFLKLVWNWKAHSGGTIINQLKRLGASCDWDREAFTMSGAPNAPEGEEGNFHDAVIKVFVEMYNKGLIYRGKRLVNWDPHFETAISDLEVENIETPGHMWHFKYPLAGGATYTYVEKDEDGNVTLEEERDYISIATTRPETMLGDGAVAVHPSDERYAPIVGRLCEIPVGPKEHRRLIPIITDDYPDPDFGSGAVKITGAHDFNDRDVADRNDIPKYRLMDTKAAMRSDGAPYAEAAEIAMAVAKGERSLTESEVDEINLVPDDLRGLDRFEARTKVVEQITAEGLAVTVPTQHEDKSRPGFTPAPKDDEEAAAIPATVPYVESKPIMQPFGDRSKVVIEPMLTDQWFVDTAKIVGPALDAVKDGTVKILPESGEKTYYHWLENIEPWCISRQLWWGHQIPVWFGPGWQQSEDGSFSKSQDQQFCASNFEQAAKNACAYYTSLFPEAKIVIEQLLGDPEPTWPITDEDYSEFREMMKGTSLETLYPKKRLEQSRKWQFLIENDTVSGEQTVTIRIRRDPDVLDTWFSSGLWPIGTLGWPEQTEALQKYFPTSTLVTGQDILFFWVARMMMMQLAVVDDIPFDTVYLHGLVRDAKGKKMSKSTGNVMDPLDIIDEYGADALRFSSAAMAALGGVLKLDMERIKGYRNFGTKLWNAARFAEMNGAFCETGAPDVAHFVQNPPKQTANRWIIGEVAKTRETVDEALTGYRFNDAANALYAFTWGKFCDWYIEFAKPLFASEDAEIVEETRLTMAWALDQTLILLHPIMPFITEELWGLSGKRTKPLIHADWPTYQAVDLLDENADLEMNWVISLIENIRSARQQMHVPAGLKIPVILQELNEAGHAALQRNEALIMRMARIDSVTKQSDLPKGAITVAVEGGTFALPLADIIDINEEIARLEKTLGKLAKEIGGLKGRLNNPKFAESAPPEVVEETRENLTLREEEAATLTAALERLKEAG